MSDTKPAPASTQFRVHFLIYAGTEWRVETHDVWAQNPDLARTFTLHFIRTKYGESARHQFGKIKHLRVDQTGRGWYRGKKGK